MRLFALVTTLCLLAMPAAAQDFSSVKLRTQKLSERIHVLFGAGGNIGLFIGERRILMIDDQFMDLAPRLQNEIAKLKNLPIAYLINTHYHGDHTGSNAYFKEKGALLVAHENVRARLATPQTSGMSGQTIPAAAPAALPVITFSDRSSVYEDGEHIQLIHVTEAHTDGDTLVFFKNANVIHMGDTFFHDRWPYVDQAAGGSVRGMIDALAHTIAMIDDDTIVIPGHGPVTNRTAMIKTHKRLSAVLARAENMRAKGKDKAAFLASNPGAAYPQTTKGSAPGWPDRFFSAVFDSAAP